MGKGVQGQVGRRRGWMTNRNMLRNFDYILSALGLKPGVILLQCGEGGHLEKVLEDE